MSILLLFGFILLLITFIDLGRFREPIASQLSKATGMTVELKSLNLEFAHGLGFKCKGLRFLSNDGSKELFYAEKIYLLADLKPLLQMQVKIQKATIVNPVIKIDLASSRPAKAPIPKSGETGRDDVAGQASNQVSSPPPVPGQEPEPIFDQQKTVIDFEKIFKESNFTIKNIEIKHGQILLIQKSNESAPAHSVPISVSFLMDINRPAPDRLEASIDSLQLEIDHLRLKGKGRITKANSLHMIADLTSSPITFAELKEMEKYIPGFPWPNHLKEGNLDKISLHLDLPIDDMENFNSLQENARIDFKVHISDAVYQTKAGTFTFSHLDGEGNWQDRLLTQKFWGEIFGGEFQEEGNIRFSPASRDRLSLAVESDIAFKGLDFSLIRLANKENSIPSQGKAFGSFKFKGPVSFSKNEADFSGIQWSGSAEGENLAWAGTDFLHQAARASLHIQKGTPIMAEVEAERLTVQGIPFKKALGMFRITPETIQLVRGKIWPENGLIQMTGNFNTIRETYALNIQGDQLKAEDLSQRAVFGSVRFSGKFEGRLRPGKNNGQKMKKFSPFTRGLSGNFNVDIAEGRLQKMEGLKALLVLLNPSTALDAGKQGLEYKYIRGDFKIRNGLLLTDNLQMDGPQLKMFVAGKADLPSGKLKAEIKAMPLQMIDGLVKAIPLLGQILTGGKKGGVLETYFKVTGTLDNPEFVLLTQKSVIKKPVDIFKSLLQATQKPR